jgi:hypothetical protein
MKRCLQRRFRTRLLPKTYKKDLLIDIGIQEGLRLFCKTIAEGKVGDDEESAYNVPRHRVIKSSQTKQTFQG